MAIEATGLMFVPPAPDKCQVCAVKHDAEQPHNRDSLYYQMRFHAAHTWLAAGGQETDAMRLFGWASREMLARYGASAADERARAAHKRLSPVDRL